MSKTYPLTPDWLVTPGDVIQDFLERSGMSPADFATRLDTSLTHVNDIINGTAEITLQTSMLISRVLGGDSDCWFRLQQLYDSEQARLAEKLRPQL